VGRLRDLDRAAEVPQALYQPVLRLGSVVLVIEAAARKTPSWHGATTSSGGGNGARRYVSLVRTASPEWVTSLVF